VTVPRKGGKLRCFFVLLYRELRNDNIADIGAMMAYYAILSLFPMMVFVVTLASWPPRRDRAARPRDGHPGNAAATAELLTTQVIALLKNAHAGFAIGGAALALWGASRGASSLMGAQRDVQQARDAGVVDAAGHRHRRDPRRRHRRGHRARLLVVGPAAGHWLADRFGLGDAFDLAWDIGRWVGAVSSSWWSGRCSTSSCATPTRHSGSSLRRDHRRAAVAGHQLRLRRLPGPRQQLHGHLRRAGRRHHFSDLVVAFQHRLLFGAEINDVLADLRKDTSAAAAALATRATRRAEPSGSEEIAVVCLTSRREPRGRARVLVRGMSLLVERRAYTPAAKIRRDCMRAHWLPHAYPPLRLRWSSAPANQTCRRHRRKVVTAVFDPTTRKIPLPNVCLPTVHSNLNSVCRTPPPVRRDWHRPSCSPASRQVPNDQESRITIDLSEIDFTTNGVQSHGAPELASRASRRRHSSS